MDTFAPHSVVQDVTAHIQRTDPNLTASYIPALDWGGASLQNYAQMQRGTLNWELRATGSTTWSLREAGRCLTLASGTDGKMVTRTALSTQVNGRHKGITCETLVFTKTWSVASRRIISVLFPNLTLGFYFTASTILNFGSISFSNLTTIVSSTAFTDTLLHCIFSGTMGSNSMQYMYVKNMFTGECFNTTGTTGINTGIANTTRGPCRFAIGDSAQTVNQENCDVMLYNYYDHFKPESWAKRRLGDPWGFIRPDRHTRAIVPVATGQPFAMRQGGVTHTLHRSTNPIRQGYW